MIMRTRNNMQIVGIIGLGILILTTAWTVLADNGTISAASDDYEKSILRGSSLEWSPVGTWVVTVSTPMGNETLLHMIHAQDLTGTRYGGMMWEVNANPTNFGLFPDIEASSFWASQTVRTGPDSFESTFLYYGIKKGEGPVAETVNIGICNATWRLIGPNTNEGECTLALYLAEQDIDGDGFPDEGQEPATCMPFTYTSRRLTMMPGCVPTPMPEQPTE